MPIKVACQCGQNFAAKDELAGKKVKCPKCGQVLTIPSPMSLAEKPAEGISDLLDDVGMKAGVARCPGCGSEMAEEAILCVVCGFDLRKGHRIKTRKGSVSDLDNEDLGDLPVHGVEALDDAERAIARQDRAGRLKKGVPWWMFFLAFIGLVGFVIGMVAMPQDRVMFTSGYVLIGAGGLLSFFCWVRIWIIAFQDSTLQGLLVFFIPPYILVYIIMHWDQCGGLFLLILAGWAIQMGGYTLLIVGPMLKAGKKSDEFGLRQWQERPAVVVAWQETSAAPIALKAHQMVA